MKKYFALLFFVVACTPRPRPPASTPERGDPIAKVGAIVITSQDIQERISTIQKNFPRVYSTHQQKKDLLTEMINIELLYDEAMKSGFQNRYEFKSRLADLYVQSLAEAEREKITETETKEFFEQNKWRVEEVSARHILLKFKGTESSSERGALRKRLEAIRADLLKNPSKFPDAAKAYSEDGSAQSGGDLGYFTRAAMVAPFSDAAFRLQKPGDISPVVETQYGYHLIQLVGDRRGLENYREIVKDRLLRDRQKKVLDKELSKLKKSVSIEMYEANLLKLSNLPESIKTDPKVLIPEEKDKK